MGVAPERRKEIRSLPASLVVARMNSPAWCSAVTSPGKLPNTTCPAVGETVAIGVGEAEQLANGVEEGCPSDRIVDSHQQRAVGEGRHPVRIVQSARESRDAKIGGVDDRVSADGRA